MAFDYLEHLPATADRLGPDEARLIVGLSFEEMQPAGELVEQWEGFGGFIHHWAFHGQVVPLEGLWNCRMSLDKIAPDSEAGDMLIAGAKLGLSATFLAANNPHFVMLSQQSSHHDDITPVLGKALDILHRARFIEPADATVRLNLDFVDQMEAAADSVRGKVEENWLADLMARAVKPGGEDG